MSGVIQDIVDGRNYDRFKNATIDSLTKKKVYYKTGFFIVKLDGSYKFGDKDMDVIGGTAGEFFEGNLKIGATLTKKEVR